MGKKAAPMKAKKAAMKVSKIAKGKLAKAAVFRGGKEKTSGGLQKKDLVMSKTASERAKKQFKGSALHKWCTAVQAARKALGLKGFVAVKKGSPVYNKAKALMK